MKLTRKQAMAELHDLLTSDIYTDAPEYAERVERVHQLLGPVFRKPAALPRCAECGGAIRTDAWRNGGDGKTYHLNACPVRREGKR